VSRDERARLCDILEALEAIGSYVGGSLEVPSIDGPVVLDAVLFRLMVIGEAAKNIGAELQDAAPGIRWSDYAGLRETSSPISTSGFRSRSSRTRSKVNCRSCFERWRVCWLDRRVSLVLRDEPCC
jgi:hypothetical protein